MTGRSETGATSGTHCGSYDEFSALSSVTNDSKRWSVAWISSPIANLFAGSNLLMATCSWDFQLQHASTGLLLHFNWLNASIESISCSFDGEFFAQMSCEVEEDVWLEFPLSMRKYAGAAWHSLNFPNDLLIGELISLLNWVSLNFPHIKSAIKVMCGRLRFNLIFSLTLRPSKCQNRWHEFRARHQNFDSTRMWSRRSFLFCCWFVCSMPKRAKNPE